MAYAPYGETYAESGTVERSFTGQTQDTMPGSTSQYDFLFRQQSSSQGRWLVPDPAGLAAVDLTNPQTWNRYAYVANNPMSNVDSLGLQGHCAGRNQDGDCDPVIRIGGTDLFGGIGSLNVLLASGGSTGTQFIQPSSTDTTVDFDSSANGGGLAPTEQSFAGLSFSPGYFADSAWSGFSIYSGGSGLGATSGSTTSRALQFTKIWFHGFVSLEDWNAVYHSIVDENGCDHLMFKTIAEAFVPFPTEPAPTDVVEPVAKFLSAATYSQAIGYAASKGLTYPFKSSVFRGVLGTSEAIEASAPAVTVGIATGYGLYTAISSAINGDCH